MPKWWQERVVYQIYPRSFQDTNGDGIGDLPGIISRLDYLRELGVGGVIWLSPIYPSPNVDFGYDVSDYKAIHPDFGTMEDFDRLVAEAEKKRYQDYPGFGDQPYLRPAPVVSAKQGSAQPISRLLHLEARKGGWAAAQQLDRVFRRADLEL